MLDIRLPPTHTDEGIRLASTIRTRHARIAILVLSQHADPGHAATLLDRAGDAVGYLLKDRLLDTEMLDAAIAVSSKAARQSTRPWWPRWSNAHDRTVPSIASPRASATCSP